jgi:tRNA 2-thiouridine synthesizing protein A
MSAMTRRLPDTTVDLRGTPCPLNWVKTKLRLERMRPGMVLEVVVDEGGPARNVPRGVEAEGHRVLQVVPTAEGVHVLIERC